MAEYKLSYTAKEIDEKLGKVDALVASVNGVTPDENGNVNISVGSGGSSGVSVQADYEQNDSSESDYIKNRPFSVENEILFDGDVELVVDETFPDTNLVSSQQNGLVFDFTKDNVGESLIVEYDGVKQSTLVGYYQDFQMLYCGNFRYFIEAFMLGTNSPDTTFDDLIQEDPSVAQYDTGEPFFIVFNEDSTTFMTKVGGVHNFKLGTSKVAIDDKYKSVFQADYNQNDATGYGYIKNRPFYVTDGEPIFDEDVTTVLDAGGYGATVPTTVFNNLSEDGGECFNIEFNGTKYSCITKILSDIGIMWMGNSYIFVKAMADDEGITIDELVAAVPVVEPLAVDTGEPFMFMFQALDEVEIIATEEGTHHFKVTQSEAKVNNAFVSVLQADYDQNNHASPNYIKNRPFYSDTAKIMDGEVEVTSDDGKPYGDYFVTSASLNGVKVGDTFDITFDGVSYSLVGEDWGGTFVSFGNLAAMYGNVSDGEVPFVVNVMVGSQCALLYSNVGTHSVSITYTKIKKFSSKFIDWEGDAPTGGSTTIDPSDVLPKVTTEDNDKVLMVVDGVWQPALIANGDEVSY